MSHQSHVSIGKQSRGQRETIRNTFIQSSMRMCDDQVNQLDLSRILITAVGGKLIVGGIIAAKVMQ